MNRILFLITLLTFALPTICVAADNAEPERVIFDTDITGDVDDVLTLAMLHSLADRGQCELLAVTISKINPLTGPFTDAVNTFYGRPDLPIGITHDSQKRASKYLHLVETKDNGILRYPHDLKSNDDAPDAVSLLREVLAAQPDHSVSIIQVGTAVNVAGLLESEPDQYSELHGIDLVKQKVKLLSVMAGAFQKIGKSQHFIEANVKSHISSMKTLAKKWPADVSVVWSGFEIGIAVPYPRTSVADDFNYLPHHIVKEAYLLHSGPNHDRPTWDLSSALYAVFPGNRYYNLSEPVSVVIEDDGFLKFEPSAQSQTRFLVLTPAQIERTREAMVQLVSQPPRK